MVWHPQRGHAAGQIKTKCQGAHKPCAELTILAANERMLGRLLSVSRSLCPYGRRISRLTYSVSLFLPFFERKCRSTALLFKKEEADTESY
jgi:hypothetical protein